MIRRWVPPAVLLTAFLILWELACRWLKVPVFILPGPSRILQALWQWREPLLKQHLPATFYEVAIGMIISVVMGVAMAAAMHVWPTVNRALYPLLVASQTIPIIAIAPVFMLWFGYSLTERVAVVVLCAFFPVVVNTFDGLRSADPDLLAWMQAAGASRWRTLRMVEAPAALPSFFTGLKMAGAFSVTGAVIGEYLGATDGLGIFGRRAGSTLKSPELFASVLLLALLGIALFLLMVLVERWVTPYRSRPGQED